MKLVVSTILLQLLGVAMLAAATVILVRACRTTELKLLQVLCSTFIATVTSLMLADITGLVYLHNNPGGDNIVQVYDSPLQMFFFALSTICYNCLFWTFAFKNWTVARNIEDLSQGNNPKNRPQFFWAILITMTIQQALLALSIWYFDPNTASAFVKFLIGLLLTVALGTNFLTFGFLFDSFKRLNKVLTEFQLLLFSKTAVSLQLIAVALNLGAYFVFYIEALTYIANNEPPGPWIFTVCFFTILVFASIAMVLLLVIFYQMSATERGGKPSVETRFSADISDDTFGYLGSEDNTGSEALFV